MKKFLKIFIAIAVLVLAGGAVYYFVKSRPVNKLFQPEVLNQTLPESQKIYENGKYGFSFSHPKEFNFSEFPEGGADVVLVSDAKASVFSRFRFLRLTNRGR